MQAAPKARFCHMQPNFEGPGQAAHVSNTRAMYASKEPPVHWSALLPSPTP